jgi:hypothetical protein
LIKSIDLPGLIETVYVYQIQCLCHLYRDDVVCGVYIDGDCGDCGGYGDYVTYIGTT